jgi:hypothetical protein
MAFAMMNTMIFGLPGESHGRRQSISVVLSLIHRRQLLLNRSLTKYRADLCTSRLTKWWHEFPLLVLFWIPLAYARKMILDGTQVGRSAHQSGYAGLQDPPLVLIVAKSFRSKIHLLL